MSVRVTVPLYGETPLPWAFFLLEACRGSVKVPDWVQRAVTNVIAVRSGKSAEDVDEDDLGRIAATLPKGPGMVLRPLLAAVELEMPDPADALRLGDASAATLRSAPCHQEDLLHDVAVMMQADFGKEAFVACLEEIDDGSAWDARGAVAVMIYVLLLYVG